MRKVGCKFGKKKVRITLYTSSRRYAGGRLGVSMARSANATAPGRQFHESKQSAIFDRLHIYIEISYKKLKQHA